MTVKHLVLFDIDGTLLSTNGQGVEALMVAYRAVWGRDPRSVIYAMSGKTELGISHELLALLGFSRAEVESGLPRFWERYPLELRRLLVADAITVHPGVRELVAAVKSSEDMLLGLLTGNCEAAAKIKLETVGLHGFAMGAYGEHHEDRAALPPLAAETARELCGRAFAGKSVTVIGDTPNDIACGRSFGVKSIAVATGGVDADTLARHAPDHLFADLSPLENVMEAIRAV